MKKLVVKEFTVTEEDKSQERELQPGDKYSYFEDPETGKCYRPVEGFTVTGEDLSDRFVEIEAT